MIEWMNEGLWGGVGRTKRKGERRKEKGENEGILRCQLSVLPTPFVEWKGLIPALSQQLKPSPFFF